MNKEAKNANSCDGMNLVMVIYEVSREREKKDGEGDFGGKADGYRHRQRLYPTCKWGVNRWSLR